MKVFLLIVSVSILPFKMHACDVCVGGGGGFGISNVYRSNFVSLVWEHSNYQTSSGYGISSIDDFQILEISARYFVSERLKLQVHIPYKINLRDHNNTVNSLRGLSDVRLFGNYTILKDVELNKLKLYSEFGLGVKLPSGKYDRNIHRLDLPTNFNLGQGNFGIGLRSDWILSSDNYGFMYSLMYLMNGASPDGYLFGNQQSMMASAYRRFKFSEAVSVNPNLGLRQESIAADFYSNGNEVKGTKIRNIFASIGSEVSINNWRLGFMYLNPLSTNDNNEDVNAQSRTSFQLTYILK